MEKLTGRWKYQAGPGYLFCTTVKYETLTSNLVLPDQKNTVEKILRVKSVGPGVEGFKEGDLIQMATGKETPLGIFVLADRRAAIGDVMGRLVPEDAPNSAVTVPKAAPTS